MKVSMPHTAADSNKSREDGLESPHDSCSGQRRGIVPPQNNVAYLRTKQEANNRLAAPQPGRLPWSYPCCCLERQITSSYTQLFLSLHTTAKHNNNNNNNNNDHDRFEAAPMAAVASTIGFCGMTLSGPAVPQMNTSHASLPTSSNGSTRPTN